MRLTLLTIFGCLALNAQVGTFHAPVTGTLSASASTTLTIQQPAAGAKSVTFIQALASCNGQSFTLGLTYNGTAATTTSAAVIPMMTTSSNITNAALAWSASNVGNGTLLSSVLPYGAGSVSGFDLTKPGASMSGNGTAKNLNVILTNTGGSSCTYTLDVIWSER